MSAINDTRLNVCTSVVTNKLHQTNRIRTVQFLPVFPM